MLQKDCLHKNLEFFYFERNFGKLLIAIGNAELESKFAKGIELIKRDIVFAASLYL